MGVRAATRPCGGFFYLTMENEIWLPVKDFEGLYEVSSCGRVRSLGNGIRNSKQGVLKPFKKYDGYFLVGLHKNGKVKVYLIHRLVAETFIPNLFDYQQVNHIDENKTNNNVENLEWCDHKYNCNYGTRNKRISEKMTNGKKSKPILQFTKTGELVREYPSTREAGRNGFHPGHIIDCCKGKQKYHKGFIWKYKQ